MTLGVTLLLLLAAVMHASWNAFIKDARDPVAMATTIYGTGAILLLPALPFVGLPPATVWFLLALHLLLHGVYKIALVSMFRHGDLSHVYPVSRGVAPLLVTLIAIPAAGELPGVNGMSGIALVCVGLMFFALERGALSHARLRALLLALLAGVVMSAYTVVDGLGVRVPGAALSYVAWLFVLDGLIMLIIARLWRGDRIYTLLRDRWKTGVACGMVSVVNFGIVLWALSFSGMGAVSALKETSVVFAALIGAFFMGESFGKRRVFAAVVIAAGIFWMNIPD